MKILFNIPHEDYVMRGAHIMGNVYSLKKIPQKVLNAWQLFGVSPRSKLINTKLSDKAIDRILSAKKPEDG